MKKKVIITLIIVAVGTAAFFFMRGGADNRFRLRSGAAEKGVLEINVTASGTIEPVTQVDVGTQVSGIVTKIYVDFNSEVKAGQLLAELDKSTLSERVKQNKASLENAKSNQTLALQNYERTKLLYDNKAATTVALEEAENKLTVANGQVVTSQADYNQSLVNLSYADIYSPIAGVIMNRAVEEGQTVASSFSTPTLFSIANDLTKMQVEADIDEADIGRIAVGQSVVFTVDTYPGEDFLGAVTQIRLEPKTTSNVVTYTVIIDAANPEKKLFPGMTANVTITTQSPEGILVPAEALYFKPDQTKLPFLKINDIESNGNKLWLKNRGTLQAIAVKSGASDGVHTIILDGISIGDSIALGVEQLMRKEAKAGLKLFPGRPPGR